MCIRDSFTEAGSQWGFESKNVSHGVSLCDLDNDGDQDVVVNCLNEPPLLYRNNATAPRVSVALRGARGNTRGIGARIIVRGGPYEQSQEMIAGGRYLAGDEPLRSFAAGQAQSLTIEVAWPSGKRTVVTGAKPNHAYEIHEKNTQPKPPPLATPCATARAASCGSSSCAAAASARAAPRRSPPAHAASR